MSQVGDPTTGAETERVLDVVPADALESSILVMGPTLSKKDEIATEFLARSWTPQRPPFAITATESAASFRSRVAGTLPSDRPVEDLYVIDATESSGTGEAADLTNCASTTPADLTGVGICLSKGYERFGTPGGRVVLVDNLSTFLVYSDIERIFRFVNVIDNRVTELDDITVQLLDSDAVDSTDRSKLMQLFPTVIEVRTDGDETDFRLRGDVQTDWYGYAPAPEGRR